MDPFATVILVAVALGIGFLLLVAAYALLHRRLAPDSKLKRHFQRSILWSARTLRFLGNAYYLLGLGLLALFWYLTVIYS